MLRKKLTSNIPLKIISLIVGFLIWLIVVNMDNPRETRVFTISGDSVDLVNTAYIDSFNKMCMKGDSIGPLKVTVTAERKTLRRLTASDISVVADLQQVVSLETSPVMVPVTASITRVSVISVKVSPQYFPVTLEDKVSQDFVVTPGYGDTKPGRGYEVGTQTVSPEKVKITGPRSLVSKIGNVSAIVNVSGKTRDVSEDVTLTIQDKNQDILSGGKIDTLTIDNGAKVTVQTRFWKIMTGVGFVPRYYGEAVQGYQVESITTVPDSISIAGTEEALESLREEGSLLTLNAPSLDITGKTGEFEQKIGLASYLPEGTKLTSGSTEDVYVTILILPVGAHEYTVHTNEIAIQGLVSPYQANFEVDSVAVRVKAKEADAIEVFRPSYIKASVDVSSLTVGTTQVPVTITLPEGYELLEDVTTNVNISEPTLVEDAENG